MAMTTDWLVRARRHSSTWPSPIRASSPAVRDAQGTSPIGYIVNRKKLKIAVIISVRNDAQYLKQLLPRLADQGIDIIVLDNESDDDTADVIRETPVLFSLTYPYHGHFSLRQQLRAKQAVIETLDHDWVIHQDADEILEHSDPSRSLRDAITEADSQECNVVNFGEFCFLPEPDADYTGRDYVREMTRYYYFEPQPQRLNRAWKRGANLDNIEGFGHKCHGASIRIAPEDHVLRHYIVLSQEHAVRKYSGRVFDPDEVNIGAHVNRIGLTHDMLRLPRNGKYLQTIENDDRSRLSRIPCATQHYWHWNEEECQRACP